MHIWLTPDAGLAPDAAVFGDDDYCYGFARGVASGLFTWDVKPEDLVEKLHISLVTLRTFTREPHRVARRGCVVEGVGAWPEAEFALVNDTQAVADSGQRFGFVSAVLDIGSTPLTAVCAFPVDDDQASADCLSVIDGVKVEEAGTGNAAEKFVTCARIPEGTRAAQRETMEAARSSWASVNDAGVPARARKALAQACKGSSNALEQTLIAAKCQ